MMDPALLIDFGSTFTKVTAVDLDAARIIGRAQAPSTVGTDVCDGLLAAFAELNARHRLFRRDPTDLDALDCMMVRACSSAAGGLRIAVVGLVPGLTVAAGRAAALGAGAKIVGTFAFKLAESDIDALVALGPDLVLLTGGTDGGDTGTILHNGTLLARSRLSAPVVAAGNSEANVLLEQEFINYKKSMTCVSNLMSNIGVLSPQAVQEEVRRTFMRRIVDAKGLERVKERVNVVLPTPVAVQRAAILGARGTTTEPGCGDLMLVDVGGATTDVYSIGEGRAHEHDVIPQGLPEPFVKRTVEGDIGVRWNAATILDQVGIAAIGRKFDRLFPDLGATTADIERYIGDVSAQTDRLPARDWEHAIDALLAHIAIDLAVERHAGRRQPYYAREGTVHLQTGKDLRDVATLIGTGGIFTRNPYAERVLSWNSAENTEVLRPVAPRVFLDRDYVLYAVGLLAESHPDVAMRLLRTHVIGERNLAHSHPEIAHHDHDCC